VPTVRHDASALIGEGGMGAVDVGSNARLQRRVAVEALRGVAAADRQLVSCAESSIAKVATFG
jgi:hypothetical protein